MIKVVNNHSRTILIEGRNKGIGTAFAKKVNENTYETIMPVSPCKDYMNDIVAVENDYPEFSVYGLTSKKTNLFKDNEAYIVLRVTDRKKAEEAKTKTPLEEEEEKEKVILRENYKRIQDILNELEKNISSELTEIYKAEDEYYVLKVPMIWVKNGPMISFYLYLVRIAMFATSDLMTLLLIDKLPLTETSFIKDAIIFYNYIINGLYPEVDYKNDKQLQLSSSAVHGLGYKTYITNEIQKRTKK